MSDTVRPKVLGFWLEIIPSALALLLALVTVYQGYANRSLQDQLAKNQAALSRAQTLTNLDNSLVQLMAKAVIENNDGAMRDLLSRNGVTLNAKAPAPAQPPAQDGKK